MATWQLQDAKAKLSEVIDTAKRKGPQIITQRGVKTAVLLPFDKWEQSSNSTSASVWKPGTPLTEAEKASNERLLEVLRACPHDFEVPPCGRIRLRKPVRF